jgi:hypothetical protein
MPEIYAIHQDEIPWQRSEAKQVDGRAAAVSHKKFRAEGHPAEVVLVDWGAGFRADAHSHEADEVICILDGEITIGDQTYGAGTNVFITKHTVYGPLVAGPQGVRFLNLRTAHDRGAQPVSAG